MKILVYGAGVIGSIYAAKLYEAKFDVVLLARGKRYETLKQYDLILRDSISGKQTTNCLPLIQQLDPTDFYDLVIVTVRLDQLASVISVLKQNTYCSLIMFMLNNPGNAEQLADELAPKHIMLGFPGAGGTYCDNRIDYMQLKEQKTTIGEIDGRISTHTKEIKALLKKAKFVVDVSSNIQAWLKTHAIFVACVAAAIIKENGDSVRLGKNKSSVELMVKSISEGLAACKSQGMPIAPANLRIIFTTMPQWFSVLYWQRAMQGKVGTLAMAPHATAAKQEMQLLAKEVLAMVHSSSVSTPVLDEVLLAFISSR